MGTLLTGLLTNWNTAIIPGPFRRTMARVRECTIPTIATRLVTNRGRAICIEPSVCTGASIRGGTRSPILAGLRTDRFFTGGSRVSRNAIASVRPDTHTAPRTTTRAHGRGAIGASPSGGTLTSICRHTHPTVFAYLSTHGCDIANSVIP